MSTQNRTTLKSYFETGDKPTQSQFADLIDSMALVSEVQGTSTSGITIPADDQLKTDDIGKLVMLKDGKAKLLNMTGDTAGQKGKWQITVNNLLPELKQDIKQIDFTNVTLSDIQDGGTSILFSYNGIAFIFRNSPMQPNDIQIATTIEETLDNFVSTANSYFMNNSSWLSVVSHTRLSRTGLIITVDSSPTNMPQFNHNGDYVYISGYGFVTNSPIITTTQNIDRSLLAGQFGELLYFGNLSCYTTNVLQQRPATGNYTQKWQYYFPATIEDFMAQIVNYLQAYFSASLMSGTVVIEEYAVPKWHNSLYWNSNVISVQEIHQSLPYYAGDIEGLFLGELLDVHNGNAIINAADIFGAVAQTPVTAGDILMPADNGFVVKPLYYGFKDEYCLFVALTSGTSIKVRLVHNLFYLKNNSSSSNY